MRVPRVLVHLVSLVLSSFLLRNAGLAWPLSVLEASSGEMMCAEKQQAEKQVDSGGSMADSALSTGVVFP
jgi:hypothetical protein